MVSNNTLLERHHEMLGTFFVVVVVKQIQKCVMVWKGTACERNLRFFYLICVEFVKSDKE